MKIAIDARGINLYKGTGIGTYTQNVLKNILDMNTSSFYNIYWYGENYKLYEQENTKIIMTSKKHRKFFEYNYFPNNLNKDSVDIYHIPQNGMGMNLNIPCKKVCTIHDLIPYTLPETVGKGYLKNFLKTMPEIVELSDGIITVSEYSKKDILKFFPQLSPDNIFVTPLAADSIFTPLNKDECMLKVKNKYSITKPFILYIGGFSARKNVETLINAFKNSLSELNEEHELVIVGSLKDEGEILYKKVIDMHLTNIKFIGFVEDNMLPILYNSCRAFIYPSLYEGFGLPPLEAMSCGTPVITSNTTSIPEVVQDAGILINPHNEEELTRALINLLNNRELREVLRNKGLKRSKEFSWKATAEKTYCAYEKISN
ncbi:Glycosyltransferase involved in cell wall bisynthesis [Clostridium amylolyticum]|uniref:Glycosyltransferase involved in cell wall bisynthesis n=1 Tax=Clostridium amylolyticum TaxID=1121298 RepID=A0A1M6B5E0_9CLOT|nr:glycosyltransferase family 1 protein [Clostridium amylolyticum]SHI43974.1 Glycosyltransferase involved in cell wall bisynthesis [Clostridium amylolyticum]